jgi:hypothetical protein
VFSLCLFFIFFKRKESKKTNFFKKRGAKFMTKRKVKRLKAGITLGIAVALLMLGSSMYIYEDEETGKIQLGMNTALAEYSGLSSGESGWLEIFLMPHDATPGTTYNENNSATLESSALAYFDTDGWSTSSFPSETSFDIVVRVRANRTHAYDTDHFDASDIRCSLTVAGNTGASDWAVGSDFTDSSMTQVVTQNNSAQNFIWMNFYLNNGGSGYQLADDGQLDFSAPHIEGKF